MLPSFPHGQAETSHSGAHSQFPLPALLHHRLQQQLLVRGRPQGAQTLLHGQRQGEAALLHPLQQLGQQRQQQQCGAVHLGDRRRQVHRETLPCRDLVLLRGEHQRRRLQDFSRAASTLWNSLPSPISLVPSFSTFKQALKPTFSRSPYAILSTYYATCITAFSFSRKRGEKGFFGGDEDKNRPVFYYGEKCRSFITLTPPADRDPVTLRCGHSFCWDCIDRVLDSQAQTGGYSCPECREEFQPRPKLSKNKALCNIVKNLPPAQEKLPPVQPKQKISGILCDYCIGVPVPAVKSCLHCEASLCADHLRVHIKSVEHVLTEPTSSPKTRKCSVHNEMLKYFCVQDGVCICISCSLAGEHKGHAVETLIVASNKKKENLRTLSKAITSKKKEIECKVPQLLQQGRRDKEKNEELIKRVTAVFSNIRLSMDTLEKNVLEEISRQERQASVQMSYMTKWLETIQLVLCGQMSHLEELCKMSDPLTVLQDPQFGKSDSALNMLTTDINQELFTLTSIKLSTAVTLEKSLVMKKLEDLTPIIKYLKSGVHGLGLTEVTLEKNTLCDFIKVSDDLKSASKSPPSMFCSKTHCHNLALSSRSFSSGVHYWDGEMSGTGGIGVCYSSLSNQNCKVDGNNKSWWLQKKKEYYSERYYIIHHSEKTDLQCVRNNRFRVYLDYEVGKISFYVLGNPVSHLHTFNARFTEPLHAAFWADSGEITIL
ncbi:germ cell-specific gene 1-like protein 2 isoform X2 [Hyperolius riggenbachi]|uniref:germ cell-specific gene 1-like protein 2 isoform X2 n=1 Tax=Hyperolius riggenbachi TaxID=752182 RepID=UPI0035A3D335